ncbi:MAG: alanyl-tRNA editing protein [Thermosphaera sp.]
MVDLYEWARGFGETVLLYLDDPYLREAAATLLDSSCDKPGRCYLVFDKSIFHPRSGGQPSDTGFVIDQGFSFKVEKVLMVKGVLAHYGRVLQGSPPVKGSLVKLLLDWETRHLVMRLHTAGHVLDYAVSKAYGRVVNTLDAHHGPPEAYMEYEAPPPGDKLLEEIADEASRIVREARKVKWYWVSPSELASRTYNAPNIQRLPKTSKYRIVEVEGVNAIPCTGTHVANTREIGRVGIVRVEKTARGFKLFYTVEDGPAGT